MKIGGLATAAVLIAASQNVATAQEEGEKEKPSSLMLQNVVVVAEKREENIQNVGVTMAAYSSEQLDALGANQTSDLAAFTPGVHISGALGGQLQTFTIRGVAQSDFVETAESPNALYVDEAYVGYLNGANTAMFDTERVEILKGPQGTLFGRNATGGLIHYLSKRPTEEYEAYTDFTFGSYNQLRAEAAISGPLSKGVRGRLAGFYSRHDGTIENLYPGGSDLGNDNSYGIRAMLDFDVNEQFNVLLKGEVGKSQVSTAPYQSAPTIAIVNADGFFVDTVFADPGETRLGIGPNGENVCPGCLTANPVRPVPGGDFSGGIARPQDQRVVNTEFSDDDSDVLEGKSLTAIVKGDVFGGVNMVSVTDYRAYDKRAYFDNEGQPYYHLTSFFKTQNDQFSQELRFSDELEKFRWSAGLYYLNISTDVESGFFTAIGDDPSDHLQNPLLNPTIPALNLAGVWFQNEPELDTESYSAFAQIEYDLSQELTLVLGGRIIEEKKDYSHSADAYLVDQMPAASIVSSIDVNRGAYLFPLDSRKTFSTDDTLWSGKAQLEWRPNSDWLMYAGVNRGIKAGSFNQDYGGLAGGLGTVFPASYDEEVLVAYETGFKSTLLDGRARLNGAYYYYDYSDFQAFRYTGLSFYVTNNDARAQGGELDLIVSPMEGLEIGGSASYVDFTVKDVVFDTGPRDVEAPYVPKFQLNALARYSWDMFDGEMSLQGNVSYSDSFFFSATNFTSTEAPSYTTVDLRLAYETNDGDWQFEAFGKNVFDEFYKTVGFDLTNLWGAQQYVSGAPAWWGVSVRRRFD